MATQLQIRRGTSAQVAAFTGAEGEIVVNTTNDSVHVNDGSTAGGFEMARVDGSNWAITNAISTTANISFGDNDKAIFGAGSDLQIYHDGSNSYIAEAGTGDLRIRGANVEIQTGGGNKYFQGSANVARLYHTNNEKLATSGAGIAVTGTVVSDGATIAGTLELDNNNFDHTSATPQYNMIESDVTGENTQFLQTAGDLRIRTVDDSLANPVERLRIDHSTGDISFYEDTGTTPKFFWDASQERVELDSTNATPLILERNGGTDANVSIQFNCATSDWYVGTNPSNNFAIGTNLDQTNAAFQINSSGSVGIGTSSPATLLELSANNNGAAANNTLRFTDTDTGTQANQQIGKIEFKSNDSSGDGALVRSYILSASEDTTPSSYISFGTNPGGAGNTTDERMRIDASGNLLVGTTDTNPTTGTSEGIVLGAGGIMLASNTSDAAMALNRTSTNGDIAIFKKDGATVGRLSNNNTYFFIAGGASGGTHSGLRFVNSSSIRPCTSGGSNSNNVVAFGATSARWTVIYATTGTINTSDRREKQDIEALSDAEQRVAVAAKGLLRKFRWIDAVEAKGDDARIHFGIIAQDLQDAFTAEGLDAGRYAMFCSDTFWIDTEGESYETQEEAPEGATEQTRLGVRYSELLAFIISAI